MTHDTSTSVPKYRRQRRRGRDDLAFVELDGRRHYLGPYDSPESKEAYRKHVREWTAAGCAPPVCEHDITVVQLISRFWQHAESYYRKPDGTPTSTLQDYRAALKPLRRL